MHLVQTALQLLARNARAAQVHGHQVVVRAAGDKAQPLVQQRLGQHAGVLCDILLIFFEFRLQRFAEAHGLGRDDMLQRAALGTRENSLVDGLGVLLPAQDQAAAGAAQRFVGGGCHHVGIGHGVRVQASGHKPRDVRHIHHKQRAVFPGDLRDAFKINGAGVGRSARDDHFGLVLLCFFLQIRIIQIAVFVHAVCDEIVVLAAHVHRAAVGEVAAVGKIHAQDGIAHVQQRKINGQIGLRARMRLHIGVLGAEQPARAVAGNVLHHVHALASAVVAVPAESSDFCHRLVLFGREHCTARSPKCEGCPLGAVCPSYPIAK